MPRVQHSDEFIKERNRANQQRYREKHAEELKERRMTRGDTLKKRESRRAEVSMLIEAGVFEKLKPGGKQETTDRELETFTRAFACCQGLTGSERECGGVDLLSCIRLREIWQTYQQCLCWRSL